MSISIESFGTCEICGKEANLYHVCDLDLCEECIEENYITCDHCQEYFTKDNTIVYYLKDGKVLCEDCAIYALNFSGLTEDDIESIYDPEEDEENQ